MGAYNVPGYCQPKPATRCIRAAGAIKSIKRFENFLAFFFRNARAIIIDSDLYGASYFRHRDHDIAAI